MTKFHVFLRKTQNLLLLLFLFLLPWQTRYIWQYGELNKGFWEYGTFSIYATEILLWIILLLFFCQHFLKKEFWIKLKEKKSRTSLILILFLFFLILSTALSDNFWVSYNYIFHVLEAMALMMVLVWQNEKIKYQIVLWAGAVAQGALAIWQFLTQHVWASKWLGMAGQEAGNLGPSVIEFADQRWLRAYGSFGSPNSLGIYLAVLFVFGLVLYLKSDDYHRHEAGSRCGSKIIISVGQLVILSGLLVSYSRGAWLAAAVGAVSVFIVLIKNFYSGRLYSPLGRGRDGLDVNRDSSIGQPTPGLEAFPAQAGNTDRDSSSAKASLGMTALKAFAKQISFALAVIIFWLVVFYPVFTARFNLDNRLEAKSISERYGQYAEALSFIKPNPIFGIGPGAYTYALYKKYPTLSAWQYQPIHNIYLLALVEIGLAGVIFLFFLFKHFLAIIIKNNLIYTPIIVTMISAGLFDHWLWSMSAGILLWWVVWGLVGTEKFNADN